MTADITKQAVLYLRVSTARQASRGQADPEGFSLPAQREACERKAADLGATVVSEFVDRGESGRMVGRHDLQRMLVFLKENPGIDYVIVYKVSRFARNRFDDAVLSYEIERAGAQLVSALEHIDRSPSGQLIHGILATVAEFESLNMSVHISDGLLQKAKVGGTPGPARLGYRNMASLTEGMEVRTIVLDEERAPHVRFAFEAYASGEYSLESLRAELGERGLTTRPTKTAPERPISRGTLHRLLQDPYYLGIVEWKGVQYPGRHEPLVDEELFNRVQAVLRAHSASTERQRKHHHYLKGSVYCDRCQARLCITRAKGRGGTYMYFFCSGRHRGGNCLHPYVLIDQVEKAIERYYATVQLTAEEAETVRAKYLVRIEEQAKKGQRHAGQARKRLAKLEVERLKLLQATTPRPCRWISSRASRSGSSGRSEKPNGRSSWPRCGSRSWPRSTTK